MCPPVPIVQLLWPITNVHMRLFVIRVDAHGQHVLADPSTSCPNCGSRYLGQFGVGTQRVEDELQALLGDDVSIIRMDADTTRTKGAHQRLLERFDASDCAVLIGTQMVAKGLDFPEVTLVGVVNADTTLKLPDFRAAERTYDLLEQVAGRAGRGDRPGRVIIQTYWASIPQSLRSPHTIVRLFLQASWIVAGKRTIHHLRD